MSKDALVSALSPILEALDGLSPSPEAEARLRHLFPLGGEVLGPIEALMRQGAEEGWLCPRATETLRYGRLCKPGPQSRGCSVDAVDMRGEGAGHTHTAGEFDLCFAVEGEPRFDGRPAGWTVYPPQSWHVPTVTGGRMLILYFLPEGAIRFEAAPTAGATPIAG
jgi:hypothetical protein